MDFPTIANGFLDFMTWVFRISTLIFSYVIVWRTAWFANSTNQVPPWGRMAYQITVFCLIILALNYAPAAITKATTDGLARSRAEQDNLQRELEYWVDDVRPDPSAEDDAPVITVGNDDHAHPTADPNVGGGGDGTGGGGVLPTATPQVVIVVQSPTPMVTGDSAAGSGLVVTLPPSPVPATPTLTPTPVIPTLTPTVDPSLWTPLTPAPPLATATPQGR